MTSRDDRTTVITPVLCLERPPMSNIKLRLGQLTILLVLQWIRNSEGSQITRIKVTQNWGPDFLRLASRSKQLPSPDLADNSTSIPVNIQLKPALILHGLHYVATNTRLVATAEILDDRFRNMSLTYQWSIKNKTITTDPKASQITYNFTEPHTDFMKVLVVHLPDYSGTIQKNLVIRDPINIAEPIGKLFLEHGELVRLTLRFSGTGPYRHCHRFCYEDDQKTCDECTQFVETRLNEVNITHYLHFIGNYVLLFTVDNVVSQPVKKFSVKITESVVEQTIPYTPIVCTISAVLILLMGVVLHVKLKETVHTETADFDFIRHLNEDDEVWDEEQSLSQRVWQILAGSRRLDQNAGPNASLNGSSSFLRIT